MSITKQDKTIAIVKEQKDRNTKLREHLSGGTQHKEQESTLIHGGNKLKQRNTAIKLT